MVSVINIYSGQIDIVWRFINFNVSSAIIYLSLLHKDTLYQLDTISKPLTHVSCLLNSICCHLPLRFLFLLRTAQPMFCHFKCQPLRGSVLKYDTFRGGGAVVSANVLLCGRLCVVILFCISFLCVCVNLCICAACVIVRCALKPALQ